MALRIRENVAKGADNPAEYLNTQAEC